MSVFIDLPTYKLDTNYRAPFSFQLNKVQNESNRILVYVFIFKVKMFLSILSEAGVEKINNRIYNYIYKY